LAFGAESTRPAQLVGVTTSNVNGASTGTVRINGEVHRVPNPTGMSIGVGMSVTVQRLENGRYQIIGLAGHWAPQP